MAARDRLAPRLLEQFYFILFLFYMHLLSIAAIRYHEITYVTNWGVNT